MTDIDYPPTKTVRLGAALDALDGDDDANHEQGLRWAVHGDGREEGFDGWGEDAEVTLQAATATFRSDVVDTLNRTMMGPAGPQRLKTWLVMCSVVEAPWLNGDEGYQEMAAVGDSIPPGFEDWLGAQFEELNDLGN